MQHIGTYRIVAPSAKSVLIMEDGLVLAKDIGKDIKNGFVDGHLNILFLIPEDRPTFYNDGSTIMADFFIGLFEELFKKVHGTNFKGLSTQLKRSRFQAVHNDPKNVDVMEEFIKSIEQHHEIYSEFEQFITSHVSIGVLHADNTYTLAEYDDGRMMKAIENKKINDMAYWHSYKYYKALDAITSAHFNACQFIADHKSNEKLENKR